MNEVRQVYERLIDAFGPQGWWPSDTSFETAVGAILTQGTAWTNAERAIDALRTAGVLTPEAVSAMAVSVLTELVRTAGFQVRKARTIRALAAASGGTEKGWAAFLALDEASLRKKLLAITGIGPETADAILLYAAERPTFVVDAYTTRLAVRHGLVQERARYEEVQRAFASSLPADAALLGEYHALIVRLGKEHCRRKPRCDGCPLEQMLSKDRRSGASRTSAR